MDTFINHFWNISNSLSSEYNLDVQWFFVIYLISFAPFYFGYFLMAYGTTRNLKFTDLIHLRFRHKLQWHSYSNWGLLIHLFGRVMPYVYILIIGRNLPLWVYFLIVSIIGFSVGYLLYKILQKGNRSENKNYFSVIKKDNISDPVEIETIWEIYNHTFEKVNRLSPCRQSFDHDHFVEALRDSTIHKYLLQSTVDGTVGIGLITNDFKNAPWISSDYFKAHFPEAFAKNTIYYFLGLAIKEHFRARRLSLLLIEDIIDEIPHDAIMGFDHSRNINPLLHHFTKVVRQARSLMRTHIDRQHYHIVQRK